MDTHLLLEEMRILQQREQRRQSLLSHMASSGSSNYPMSTAALLGGLSSSAANPSGTNSSLLLELQQKLLGPGALSGMGNSQHGLASALLQGSGPPGSFDMSTLLAARGYGGAATNVSSGSSLSAAAAALGVTPGSLNTANMSNEDLLRAIAAAGMSAAAVPQLARPGQSSPTLNSASTNSTLPASFLNTLASAVETSSNSAKTAAAERKSGGNAPPAASAKSKAAKPEEREEASNKRQRLMSHDDSAVHVLAQAAAEMEKRQQAQADAIVVRGKLSPEGNSFPLPPEKEEEGTDAKENKAPGMPKLTSFRAGWDNIKTKELQKEIFLRKLYEGKWASK